ncbi:MAG: hypothetical protein H7A33_03525 [Deltaproteobacteria bacterium]|nr:hypothetical protein [Deltaproteobacteria bacterium]
MRASVNFLFVFCLLFGFAAHANLNTKFERYFDAAKLINDIDLTLNDSVEFAVFDLSEVKIIDDSSKSLIQTEDQNKDTDSNKLSSVSEIKKDLGKLPQFFYKALKEQILAQDVPVTLYPSKGPGFTKPLKFFVKIKRIHLKTPKIKGSKVIQPFSMRIYGQLKEAKSGKMIIKFYDSGESDFILGNNQASQALDALSQNLMKDLARYLKTVY